MGRHGENIRKRTDGRWEARYIQYYDSKGKAVYRYIYGKTYAEVKQKRKTAMSQESNVSQTSIGTSKLTFRQLAEEWLIVKRAQVKQSTYANYVNMLNNHIYPRLGNVYVSSLTTQTLEKFLQSKLLHGRLDGKGGLSGKTVSDLSSILKLILQYAKRNGYFCPTDLNFSAPSVHPPQIDILQKEECEKLVQIVLKENKRVHLGILIALYGGLRIGEVCALQWKDFNFAEGTVNISKTVIRITNTEKNAAKKTKILVDKPKTECANRIIPLPKDILLFLEKEKKAPETFVLTGNNHCMEPRVCLENYKKILKRADIRSHTFHALRHTFATRCIELGFDVKTLSEIMGHSNISITMQRYVHPSMEQKKAQMNKLSLSNIHGQNSGHNYAKPL